MKNSSVLYFPDERHSCACGAPVTDAFHVVETRGFTCLKCAKPLICVAKLSDDRERKFLRLPENKVTIGDELIVGGAGNRAPREVLGIAVNQSSRNFSLRGHGPYHVPFQQILCVIPRRWT